MFGLDENQRSRLLTWKSEQDKKVASLQKEGWKDDPFWKAFVDMFVEKGMLPYYGCTGGGYTYHFTPTSLEMVIRVSNSVTKDEVDLTDYETW